MALTIVDRDWRVLLDSLERGSCAALLGPDLPTTGANGEPRNLTAALSRHLASILESEEDTVVEDPDNLPLVAQDFLDGKTRTDLEVEVTSFYEDLSAELDGGAGRDETFESLAALPFPLFITSRHDRMLEHCLLARGKQPVEKRYHFKGDQKRTVGELGTFDRPLVYRLLGAVEDPGSLALTESDLLDLLEAIVSGNPALPTDLRNAFKAKSFLFLGCGLRKYYQRVLLHVLGLTRSRQRSFALEEFPETCSESVWFYKVGYRTLKLIDSDEKDFIRELRQRWEEKHPDGQPSANPPPAASYASADRPKVFVSYREVRADASIARQLVDGLKKHGIDPWFDREQLSHGDSWDLALEDAIGKEVDFFIILLSKDVRDEVESYVHLELKTALERRSRLGAVKFIYPIQIDDDAQRLDALERAKIHVSRLENLEADVATLALDIRRQFAKRQR